MTTLSAEAQLGRAGNIRRYGRATRPKPGVLHVGPTPPAVGGMVTVLQQIVDGPLARVFNFHVHPANAQPSHRRSPLRSACHHLGCLWNLRRTLGREAIDVVHLHTCSGFTFYRNLADAAVATLFKSTVVLHVHGGRFDHFYTQANPLGRWIIRQGLSRADCVVVLSESWRQQLSRFAPQANFVVIPNGVALNGLPRTANCPSPHSACRFVFLGPLTRSKGVHLLLQACDQLRRRAVPFHLTLAGPIETGLDTIDLAAELGHRQLHDHVRHVGTVTGSEKSALLARSDCLVLPSLAEGMPISILEAGATGLAVIATDVGAVRELLGDAPGPCLVPPGDIEALTDSMTRMANQPNLAQSAGAQLQGRIRDRYSLARQSELLGNLYQGLASSRRRTGVMPSLASGAQP